MNRKIVAVVIVAVAVIGVIAGCVEEPAPEETPAPSTPAPAPTAKPTAKPTATPSVEMAAGCDMCHVTQSTSNLEAHTQGGLLVNGKPGCFNYAGVSNLASGCHGIGNATVHTVHPSEVGCAACHGKDTPTIPPVGPGGTTCELCHAMPNPLESSDGRLVEIHLDRGKKCTVCHVGEISEIHGLQ